MHSTTHLTNALLSKGYFPRELPLAFTTLDFGTYSLEILTDWEKSKLFKKDFKKTKGLKGSFVYTKLPHTEAEIISKPKKGYERRHVHITHPIPQALLAREIAEHWKKIVNWLSKQAFSEDQILISEKYDRAIKGINFPLHRAKKESWIHARSATRCSSSVNSS
jgi:hypothetical protein